MNRFSFPRSPSRSPSPLKRSLAIVFGLGNREGMNLRVAAVLLLTSGCASQGSAKGGSSGWSRTRAIVQASPASADEKRQALEALVASHELPIGSKQMALVHRALLQAGAAERATFANRVSAEQVDALLGVVDRRLISQELNGQLIQHWQARLDASWDDPSSAASRAAADEILVPVVMRRDELDALLTVNRDPAAYFVALHGGSVEAGGAAHASFKAVRDILFEIALERDLLELASARELKPLEEFLQRYPDTPYSASVLFSLGVVLDETGAPGEARKRFAELVEKFPGHPIAVEARTKLSIAN